MSYIKYPLENNVKHKLWHIIFLILLIIHLNHTITLSSTYGKYHAPKHLTLRACYCNVSFAWQRWLVSKWGACHRLGSSVPQRRGCSLWDLEETIHFYEKLFQELLYFGVNVKRISYVEHSDDYQLIGSPYL